MERVYNGIAELDFWDVARYGAFTGVVLMGIGVILFWGGVLLFTYLYGDTSAGNSASPEGVMLLSALVSVAVLLIPAMLGGGLVALLLQRLSIRKLVGKPVGILVGAGVGAIIGAASLLVFGYATRMPLDPEAVVLILFISGLAALVGAGQGWVVVRWLRQEVVIRVIPDG